LLVKKTQPSTNVTGIDIDPHILGIAKKKATQANVPIEFDLGTAFDLPYPDNSFDRVLSSLVFHHLTRENKLGALKEVLRVLKENGELHIADMGKPQNMLMHLPSVVMRRLEETEDNVKGLLPQMLKNAGFNQVEETSKIMTIFGTNSFYKGLKA
jgi:ubiquinone/menaquinone biosynthesis C-methylase UbiE